MADSGENSSFQPDLCMKISDLFSSHRHMCTLHPTSLNNNPCSHWKFQPFTSCPAFLLFLCSLDQFNCLERSIFKLMSHKSKNHEFVCQTAPKNTASQLKMAWHTAAVSWAYNKSRDSSQQPYHMFKGYLALDDTQLLATRTPHGISILQEVPGHHLQVPLSTSWLIPRYSCLLLVSS